MGGIKQAQQFELNADQIAWLSEMSREYGLADTSKALRVVMDYVMDEADQAVLFTEVRCNHCNDTSNQD